MALNIKRIENSENTHIDGDKDYAKINKHIILNFNKVAKFKKKNFNIENFVSRKT
jgi:hypothetical protein